MEVKGKILEIFDTQEVSDRFKKREFVVEVPENNPQYTQKLLIQFIQDKCSILDGYQKGQEVSVSINLKGRDWTNPQGEKKYFNTIEAWKVSLVGAAQSNSTMPLEAVVMSEDDDDLPF